MLNDVIGSVLGELQERRSNMKSRISEVFLAGCIIALLLITIAVSMILN